jgi:5-oxoprolinase (ATP-hydrolysing)
LASDSQSGWVGGSLETTHRWQLWIDTGGTFTDCLGLTPAGEVRRAKVLSNGCIRGVVAHCPDSTTIVPESDQRLPESFFLGAELRRVGSDTPGVAIVDSRASDGALVMAQSPESAWQPGVAFEIFCGVEAPVLVAHWVTETPLAATLPPLSMRLATTRGTNALLEGKGSPTALFMTRGFADLLMIGTQQRPDLFALAVTKRRPLYREVIEVPERIGSRGEILENLDLDAIRQQAQAVLEHGISVAAVVLMNSYRNPRHELELSRFLKEIGFVHVSSSAELAPLIKIVPRAETAVVNAYLSQVISTYLEAVGRSVVPGPLHVLTSAGSLMRAADYRPKDSLLSGPAGGVVGAAAAAVKSGCPRSLAFDMGGTSTDVSRYDGEFDYRYLTTVGEAQLLTPSLAIETVAAGGGSICRFDGRQLKVGPESAGANPGPACYGAGGPLTLTDVNLLLGRLDSRRFGIPIDLPAAEAAARGLAAAVELSRGVATDLDRLLSGLLDIANERMAEAVRRISIRQGYRPSEFALVAFGGAGGQHACALADILNIDTVLIPQDAGLLSAVGLGRARIERMTERQILQPLEAMEVELASVVRELESQARSAVLAEGVAVEEIEIRRRIVHLRLQGQEASLPLDYDEGGILEDDFCRIYEDHYGYRPEESRIEVEAVRVLAASDSSVEKTGSLSVEDRLAIAEASQRTLVDGRWQRVPVFVRESLVPGDAIPGPALLFEHHCATLVEESWQGQIDGQGCFVLRRKGGRCP